MLTIPELFPSAEASSRVPALPSSSMIGMAFGSWFSGWLCDRFGFYAPAFGAGVLFNLAGIAVIRFLFFCARRLPALYGVRPTTGRTRRSHITAVGISRR